MKVCGWSRGFAALILNLSTRLVFNFAPPAALTLIEQETGWATAGMDDVKKK